MKINEFIKYEECAWNWSLSGREWGITGGANPLC